MTDSDSSSLEFLEDGVAGHQMVFVSKTISKRDRSMCYSFGGYTKDKGENCHMVIIDNYELYTKVSILDTKGRPPDPRYSHSMSLLETCKFP